MNQSIRVQCIQTYPDDSVVAAGEYESSEMSLEPWKQAIKGAAIAAGFHPEVFKGWLLDWAAEAEMQIDKD